MRYIVTTIGLPCAIFVFLYEQKKERDSDEEEVYQLLSDNYQDFLKIALDNPDLRLFSSAQTSDLNAEQRERIEVAGYSGFFVCKSSCFILRILFSRSLIIF